MYGTRREVRANAELGVRANAELGVRENAELGVIANVNARDHVFDPGDNARVP